MEGTELRREAAARRVAAAVAESANAEELGLPAEYALQLTFSSPTPASVSDTSAFSVEGRRVGVARSRWRLSVASVPTEAFAQVLVRETDGTPDTQTEVLAIRRIQLAG